MGPTHCQLNEAAGAAGSRAAVEASVECAALRPIESGLCVSSRQPDRVRRRNKNCFDYCCLILILKQQAESAGRTEVRRQGDALISVRWLLLPEQELAYLGAAIAEI